MGETEGLLLGWEVADVGEVLGLLLGDLLGELEGLDVSSQTVLSTGVLTLTGALTVTKLSVGLLIVGDSLAAVSKRVTSVTVGVMETPQSAPPLPSNKAIIRSLDPSPSLVV